MIRFKPCALALLFSTFAYAQNNSAPQPLPCANVDVVLAFDTSGSLNGLKNVIHGIVTALTTTYVIDKYSLNMGVLTFDSESHTLSEITHDQSQLIQKTGSDQNYETGGSTDISSGLKEAQQLFLRHAAIRNARKRVLVVVSDGEDSDIDSIVIEASKLKDGTYVADGEVLPVTIHGILLPNTVNGLFPIGTGRTMTIIAVHDQPTQPIPFKNYIIRSVKKVGEQKIKQRIFKHRGPSGPIYEEGSKPTQEDPGEEKEFMVPVEEWFIEEATYQSVPLAHSGNMSTMEKIVTPPEMGGILTVSSFEDILLSFEKINFCS